MKTLLISLALLSGQAVFGQSSVYFTADQVDTMAYLPEDAVRIPRFIRKKREKKGLPVSTPELRFLQLFYSSISVPTETRYENVKFYKVEFELSVDETGALSISDLFFIYPGVAPRLPAPLSNEPIVVTVLSRSGTIPRHNPEPTTDKPEWSTGQMALAVSIFNAVKSFPPFVPARINGVAVGSRWTVHLEYRNE